MKSERGVKREFLSQSLAVDQDPHGPTNSQLAHSPARDWFCEVEEIWSFVASGANEPALNMAIDEALLEQGGDQGRPVLRVYGWSVPAASFGYSQRFEEVMAWTPLRPLVRRCTGGGLVAHDADWTYAVAVPARHWWWQFRAAESYRRLHEWLRQAFLRLGITTQLAPAPVLEGPGRCFIGAEANDLLIDGRKLAGAAQRRSRSGLLIEGSVQPPPENLSLSTWASALQDSAFEDRRVTWQQVELSPSLMERAAKLAEEKYLGEEYLKRR